MNYTINLFNNNDKKELDLLKVNIDFDQYGDFLRGDFKTDGILIDIREHRRYNFEHDFNLNWEYLDEDFSDYTEEEKEDSYEYSSRLEEQEKYKKIQEEYYVFGLDFFEHSTLSFSLSYNRIDLGYYDFDRSKNVGIIAIKKELAKDFEEAMKIAENEISNYNSYLNGRIYSFCIEEKEEYFSKDLKKKINHFDFYEGFGGFLDGEDCKKECLYYIKEYCNSKGIPFDKIELEEI